MRGGGGRNFVRRLLRATLVLVLSELVAGVAVGLAARAAMRIVALTDDMSGTTFTIAGTLVIIIALTVVGTAPALVFHSVRRRLPGSDLARGLTFGAFLALPGLALVAEEAVTIGIGPLNVIIFGTSFLVYGAVLSVSMAAFDRRFGRTTSREASVTDGIRIGQPVVRGPVGESA